MHPPDLCRYSPPFPGYTSPSVGLPASSNRKPARATTDCSSEKSLYSSEDDGGDDGDCYRIDEDNGGDIYSVAFWSLRYRRDIDANDED